MSGAILYGLRNNTYVIKLEGALRFNICSPLEKFIERMLSEPQSFNSVMIDMRTCTAVDSTTLGLIAKVAIESEKILNEKPMIACYHKDLCHLMKNMGLESLLVWLPESAPESALESCPGDIDFSQSAMVDENEQDEVKLVQRCLDAHKLLASLSDSNAEEFKELLVVLEQELEIKVNKPVRHEAKSPKPVNKDSNNNLDDD